MMKFIPDYQISYPVREQDICILFVGSTLWIVPNIESGMACLPKHIDLPEKEIHQQVFHRLGSYGDQAVYLGLIEADEPIDPLVRLSIRRYLVDSNSEIAVMVNLAYHLHCWNMDSGFCSRCGSEMSFMGHERGKHCIQCSHRAYPRVSPCIIVAIVNEQSKVLLAEIKREKIHFHSVLAGFVEAGETLEQAVEREVMEEVGIEVKNVKYFDSQPWGFSQSLMIGFTAEHKKGDINVDGVEVHFADWYAPSDLPELPPPYSIARRLIEWFRDTYSPKSDD